MLRGTIHIRKISSVPKFYDVVIVGGGMVGNAMAASLGSSPALKSSTILLLEAGKEPQLVKGNELYSNRVSAVSPLSVNLFKKLSIWECLEGNRVQPVREMRVLDDASQSNIFFEQKNDGQQIAHIIENNAIIGSLFNRLKEFENISVQTGAKVDDIKVPESIGKLAEITMTDGSQINTNLVIGADGFNSSVRKAINTEYTAWNYDQMGIVCTLNIKSEVNDTAWQRFTPLGPLALLPLNKNLSSLVWTTSPAEAKRLLALSEDEFVDELNRHLQTETNQNSLVNQALFMLEKVTSSLPLGEAARAATLACGTRIPEVISLQSDTRAAFPLGFGHAHDYVAPRAALIGDAGHRMHPLAGQGVNLGWSDVEKLTNVIETCISEGGDIGSLTYLREYQDAAQKHNLPVMVSVDWLNRLYGSNLTPVVLARSLGLYAVNKLTPLKDLIMYKASH
uniref:Ubiquinone biosynthesis monooxygenase COQ6, mitochondrial n=1 Tax=Rhabditophanes sp. KR3021 TaxID=114890 RepID=A0AC35UBS8_9BILA